MFFGTMFFYFRDHVFFRFIARREIQLVIYLSFLWLLFVLSPNHPTHNVLGSILFSFILINGAREVSLVNLEQHQLSYFGVISYGIYIFHPYVSLVFRYLMVKISGFHTLIVSWPIIFHIIVSVFSILVAGLSYKYYESFFLRFKRRYKLVR